MYNNLRRWRCITGLGLILLGIGLLFITALGQWIGIGGYENVPARSWERFDPRLVEKTPSLDALYREAEARAAGSFSELLPDEVMKVLYKTVCDRFTHGDKARHTLFSNWIMWGLGKVSPGFSYIKDPNNLLRYGHSALCGQVSYVLLHLAEQAGIRARHVGLNGHVVMEAWYGGDWHLYDPDLEVVPVNKSGYVVSVEELSRNRGFIRDAYNGRGDDGYINKIIAIMASREDNTFVSYPVGSMFNWKAQVLLKIEQVAQVLKFIIPGLIILVGLSLLWVDRKNRM